VTCSETEVEESSFLKKRSKRLLFLRQRHDPGHGLDRGTRGEVKVFCFFSSEKKGFFQFGAGGFMVPPREAAR
jgi:hypothetical protein